MAQAFFEQLSSIEPYALDDMKTFEEYFDKLLIEQEGILKEKDDADSDANNNNKKEAGKATYYYEVKKIKRTMKKEKEPNKRHCRLDKKPSFKYGGQLLQDPDKKLVMDQIMFEKLSYIDPNLPHMKAFGEYVDKMLKESIQRKDDVAVADANNNYKKDDDAAANHIYKKKDAANYNFNGKKKKKNKMEKKMEKAAAKEYHKLHGRPDENKFDYGTYGGLEF